jgi:hypothetical protein
MERAGGAMSSPTRELMHKRSARDQRQNRKRKNKLGKKSTLSYAELFAGMGEPSTPKKK